MIFRNFFFPFIWVINQNSQQHFNPHLTEWLFQHFYNIHGWGIFLDEKSRTVWTGDFPASFSLSLSLRRFARALAPLPFCVSWALLATASFGPLFFFVDFSSSFLRYLLVICMLLLQTWCRIFLSIFFGVECNKIFPYFGFFKARVSFFCLLGVFDISCCCRCCCFMSGSLSVCVCV